jgi:hypothetical protein
MADCKWDDAIQRNERRAREAARIVAERDRIMRGSTRRIIGDGRDHTDRVPFVMAPSPSVPNVDPRRHAMLPLALLDNGPGSAGTEDIGYVRPTYVGDDAATAILHAIDRQTAIAATDRRRARQATATDLAPSYGAGHTVDAAPVPRTVVKRSAMPSVLPVASGTDHDGNGALRYAMAAATERRTVQRNGPSVDAATLARRAAISAYLDEM